MKVIVIVMTLCFSQLIVAADIIEQRPDGSKTVWHDDGSRVDYDTNGKKV